MKTKDDELIALREVSSGTAYEMDAQRKQIVQQKDRIQQLESALQQMRSSSSTQQNSTSRRDTEDMRDRLNDALKDNAQLRRELADARIQSQHRGTSSGTANPEEVKRLRSENEKLKRELGAFDAEFFDEIENLKFAHAEAMRKLRVYENRGTM
jgi:small-conductance mechanosensitive channel